MIRIKISHSKDKQFLLFAIFFLIIKIILIRNMVIKRVTVRLITIRNVNRLILK